MDDHEPTDEEMAAIREKVRLLLTVMGVDPRADVTLSVECREPDGWTNTIVHHLGSLVRPDPMPPFVVIGDGENPPWGNDRSCPTCGVKDLPLRDSDPPLLSYISHCGKTWVRGPIKPPPRPRFDPEGPLPC